MEPRGGEYFRATHRGTPGDALPQQPVFNLVYMSFASEFSLRQVIPGFSIFLGSPYEKKDRYHWTPSHWGGGE